MRSNPSLTIGMKKKYSIEIEKVYEKNDLLNILHHIGFKGLVVSETGEVIAASSNCGYMTKLALQVGEKYKEAY